MGVLVKKKKGFNSFKMKNFKINFTLLIMSYRFIVAIFFFLTANSNFEYIYIRCMKLTELSLWQRGKIILFNNYRLKQPSVIIPLFAGHHTNKKKIHSKSIVFVHIRKFVWCLLLLLLVLFFVLLRYVVCIFSLLVDCIFFFLLLFGG